MEPNNVSGLLEDRLDTAQEMNILDGYGTDDQRLLDMNRPLSQQKPEGRRTFHNSPPRHPKTPTAAG